MDWCALSEEVVNCDIARFKQAVEIWIYRPNVCCKMISCASVQTLEDFADHEKLQENAVAAMKYFNNNELNSGDALCKMNPIKRRDNCNFYYRELVPKNPQIHLPSHELVIDCRTSVLFIPISSDFMLDFDTVWYVVEFGDGLKDEQKPESKESGSKILAKLNVARFNDQMNKIDEKFSKLKCENNFMKQYSCRPNEIWLKSKLMTSLVKWTVDRPVDSKQSISLPNSLSMIPQREYAAKYQELKEKYGTQILKIWDETTDPQKYIYEDVAIATYLILLWKSERESTGSSKLQSFVDLGCGNGLLVHILNSEKHPGKGIDVRKRKIWDVYPVTTNLVEGTVDPTSETLYSEYDWLLGNHSDELTPWIPVLASRSGYNVRYWVLPCCFFDFFTKYERSDSTIGQYGDYLKFIENTGKICGFDVGTDVMRIPSTKRVCHIGMKKTYPEEKHQIVLHNITEYINRRNKLQEIEPHFHAREKLEKVRNCTKIERKIQETIVSLIIDKLLSEKNMIKIKNPDGTYREWNKGGCLALEDAVSFLSDELRNEMKSECGGLQTLLKNHHQIFQLSTGRVQMRDWSLEYIVKKKRIPNRRQRNTTKTKSCWFHNHHPDGCPKTDETCTFLH